MKNIIDYIESSCEGISDSSTLYKYKREILEKMTARSDEIAGSGLSDGNVLFDLLADEFSDIKERYPAFAAEERRKAAAKHRRKITYICYAAIFLLMFAAYFALSFTTHRWDLTWLIIVGVIFALIIYAFYFATKALVRKGRLFQVFGRILTAGSIMLATVFVYLFCLMLVPMNAEWSIIPGGIILMFAADALFAYKTRQKFAIINCFLYIPAAAAMLYVILGAQGVVPWDRGWLLVIGGVIIDLIIAAGILINNAKYIYKQEAEDIWNEN